jgi:hypothetical protein
MNMSVTPGNNTKVTLKYDIFNFNGDGYDYVADHETVNVQPKVIVASFADGIGSQYSNSTLINKGTIFAPNLGVFFDVQTRDSEIINAGGGVVSAGSGVVMRGDGSEVFGNYGFVQGTINNGVELASGFSTHAKALFVNHGGDVGAHNGVSIDIGDGGDVAAKINNYGFIRGYEYGIVLTGSNYSHLTAVINNFSGGAIAGKSTAAAIYSDNSGFTIHNYGMIKGNIVDADPYGAPVVIINAGKIKGTVHLGSGNDLFDGTGGTSKAIFAEGGNDRIICGNGSVDVHLGTGSNTVTAGPGTDRFFFDEALHGQPDQFTNFNPSFDRIHLSHVAFAGLGAQGILASSHFHVGAPTLGVSPLIVYTPNDGFLYYDAHPNLGGLGTHFATVSPHLALAHYDFLVS